MNETVFVAKTNKIKILFATLAIAICAIGTAYLLYRGPDPTSFKVFLRDPKIFYPVFIFGALLFAGLSIGGVYRLITDQSGLVVDREGVNLNDTLLVPWADILAVERYEDFTTPSLNGYQIILDDPEDFLTRHKQHRMYRRLVSNYKTISTPVAVYTNSLRMDHDRFITVVNHFLRNQT